MLRKNLTPQNNGFTLLELSIVIVIIGLIVAGISAGQSLVESAQRKQFASDIEKYKAAVFNFRLAYDALPGDLSNAHDYWGSACDNTPANCNGDGNKRIDFGGGPDANESFRLWQHLYLAGLIDEEYTGVGQGTGDEAVPGVNVPLSPLYNDVGISLGDRNLYTEGHFSSYPGAPSFGIGRQFTNGDVRHAFTPAEAYYFDNKFDDGRCCLGKLRGYHNVYGVPNCRDSNWGYSVSRTGRECSFYWTF